MKESKPFWKKENLFGAIVRPCIALASAIAQSLKQIEDDEVLLLRRSKMFIASRVVY